MMTETKFLQMSKYDQRSGLILALLIVNLQSRGYLFIQSQYLK